MKIVLVCIAAAGIITMSCSKPNRPATDQQLPPETASQANSSPLRDHLGINGFEWDFSDSDNSLISPQKMDVIRSFGGFRHYMDWEKLELEEGQYTFNPTHAGGWNYDMIYEKCKAEGIEVLSCLKNCPPWLQNTYPEGQRDPENVPAPYGLDRKDPASYIRQAKAAFQFAARYGYQKNIDPALLTVNSKPRWNNDRINTVKIGLGYIHYIECDNERDKDWKGPKAYQTAEEYAANMSAFYDGHLGKLGKNAGVKNADPSMKVVIGGICSPGLDYVTRMVEWCKKNRGYKPDGSVNLCFDVINYHHYSNDHEPGKQATKGIAPEKSDAANVANDYVAFSKKNAGGVEVWITECGFDINPSSPQRAGAIGSKSALVTQGDWTLRTALLNVRRGIKRTFFYMLDDVDVNSPIQYGSSGFSVGHQKRPAADNFFQVKNLMGDFQFIKNLNSDPIADVYAFKDRKIFILYIPDQVNRTGTYTLDLGKGSQTARIYTLVPGAKEMKYKDYPVSNGKLTVDVSETPIFVEPIAG